MAKVKVKCQPHADDAVIQECIDDANAMTPAGTSPAAKVIRDSNGKVISVEVNLPAEISKADLENARAKINGNSGVSKAIAFPIGEIGDFNSLTPGDTLAASGTPLLSDISGVSTSQLPAVQQNWPCDLKAALSADSVGATGSAHEIADAETGVSKTAHLMQMVYEVNASDNGLLDIEGYRFGATVKLKDNSFNGDNTERCTIQRNEFGKSMILEFDPNLHGNNNWWVRNTADNISADTGVDRYSFVSFEFKMEDNGVLSLSAGSASVSKNLGFVSPKASFSIDIRVADFFSSAQSGTQKSVILDDMDIEILSGN